MCALVSKSFPAILKKVLTRDLLVITLTEHYVIATLMCIF